MSTNQVIPQLKPLRKKGKLLCPDCQERMLPFLCGDVVIDKCVSCDGIWFDDLELGHFKRSLDNIDWNLIDVDHKPEPQPEHAISICPRCPGEVLSKDVYGYNTKVEIKRCSKCEGIWIEIHHLLSLMELSKLGQQIAPGIRAMAEYVEESQNYTKRWGLIGKIGALLRKRVPWYWHFFGGW